MSMATACEGESMAERDRSDDRHRGGQEPPAEAKDKPEQNVGYDEATKGRPLTPAEEERARGESPLGAGDES
jgi:hypothetical protein